MSSECSSGCQSGWTLYLAHSLDDQNSLYHHDGSSFHGEEEEEDLSMVSDASSGPPLLHGDDDHGCCYHHSDTCLHTAAPPSDALGGDGGQKKRAVAPQRKEYSAALDDTASSQLFSSSENSFHDCNNHQKQSVEGLFDFSCSFSTTHFRARPASQEQIGYSQSSTCVKPTLSKPGIKERGRERRKKILKDLMPTYLKKIFL